ncbi:MAG: uroporphyrinogen decarboxylase family protein [Candidatus Competibacteraceae bacterium]|nr:uroporphyrinogen decarboxylase family protein [Candidatus Competibacteraceae bacterium]MBK7982174.1 uroporphyrinogen decarboxylase family protein [Candidatus Competibacteraceae bacterium]MBK8899274.1 uroporphyrinogen decarboxylase family protein [Candidatus Competibacteraceae bacterium]MBK8963312.1 uroporphyrinogen decarboxylase family protein [Candidatus Competibacteraceae bacterium]MBK9952273.1 uroporphyrinogen decarboxylase family protein [Candidatus Competibacteraceae bacterium]
MTPLKIFEAALNGTPAPRIPIFCNLFDQGARELGMTQREYYAKGEHVAIGQLKLRERYGYDNVWSLFYVGREAELFGCREILYAEDGTPNVADFVIQRYDDIAKLEVPNDITDHPLWAETAQCLKILRQEVGETHLICAYVTASTTLPAMLMGMDKWLELLLMGPVDVRDELLRKCSDFFQQEIAAYRAAGANILVYATPFGSISFLDRKRFNAIAIPWMKRDLAPGGASNVVYLCGMAPFNSVIQQVRDELAIGVYYISPLADLAEAKALIGTRGLTCGVIDDIKMIRWTPEQTRAEVKRICEIGMPEQHFLFGTALMPLAVPEPNIRAMLDAAFDYGRYG